MILKITAPCPKCKAPLAIPISENDLGMTKQGVCPKCHNKFNYTVPMSYASKFESDRTIGGNEAEQTLVLETIANGMTAYQSFNLTSDYYTIGRKNNSGPKYRPDVEVETCDRHMSRIHAAIRKKGKTGFTLKGISDKKNDVFYNNNKLDVEHDEEVYLSDGDTFRLGDTVFRINIAERSDDLTQ